MSGTLGSGFPGAFSAILVTVSAATLTWCVSNDRWTGTGNPVLDNWKILVQNYSLVSAVIASVILIASMVAWARSELSYYCASTDRILLHQGLFERNKILEWRDVRAVSATCWRTPKGYEDGGLVLKFVNGQQLFLFIGNGDYAIGVAARQREYHMIRSALDHHSYDFELNRRELSQCPADLRENFEHWYGQPRHL
jgi:hypothetical protein